ncbi:calcium-binding EF-hand domain-containing protein [Reticulomyxa filosa]|uniref:Calcium-binding EF-hand domain-containing protein n=1 Tax=Reticulomyxa filosa TaxID=46433 RepID=X6M2W4_RETFI|nr:calcium-binding EF-hand domain-containing protein [Reticulomyxa filosa]|eukprot:ETO07941.1 calcium-binding EF-hand domain-containing protein [Reticulomyxa filosa]
MDSRIIIESIMQTNNQLFNVEDRNQINFRDFVKMLWTFSASASKQEKLNLAFRCYDINNNGEISTNDLCTLLRDMVGKQISDSQLLDIAKNETKSNPTGKLNKQEFLQAIEDIDLFFFLKHMLVQVTFFVIFQTLFCEVCKRQSYFLECSRLMTSGAIVSMKHNNTYYSKKNLVNSETTLKKKSTLQSIFSQKK